MSKILCLKKVKILKRKNNGMYLLNTDIEKLNERYNVLYKQVKDNPNLSKEQINRECEVLLEKYNFEIEELNALREVEYKTQQAKIKARNQEETPFRRCWIWRLLLMPLTNRPQDIIEEEAARNAEERFAPMESELVTRIAKLYNLDIKKLSQRKRKKVLEKYLKNKRLLKVALQAIDDTAHHGDVTRKAAAEQLEEIIKTADNAAPAEAFEQPEPPKEAAEAPAAPIEVAVNPSEPPPPPPKKKHKRGNKTTQPPTEPLAEEQPLEEVSTKIGAQMRLPLPWCRADAARSST